MPGAWGAYKIHYRYRRTVYHIAIARLASDAPNGTLLTLDGLELSGDTIPLRDDCSEHIVEFRMHDRAASPVMLATVG
jgi:hypothetical protein